MDSHCPPSAVYCRHNDQKTGMDVVCGPGAKAIGRHQTVRERKAGGGLVVSHLADSDGKARLSRPGIGLGNPRAADWEGGN